MPLFRGIPGSNRNSSEDGIPKEAKKALILEPDISRVTYWYFCIHDFESPFMNLSAGETH